MENYKALYDAQRAFFAGGHSRPYRFRREQLEKLKKAIQAYEPQILEALRKDLHKHPMEAFGSEVGLLYTEIAHTINHLHRWMQPEPTGSPLLQFPSRSWMLREPLGLALIIAPWNYPFQLVMAPLIAAMAAGNCAILKPSELAPHTAAVIEQLITATFNPSYIAVVSGEGQQVIPALMEQRFDHVFFTGSTAVGKKIMEMAARHLSPVTLELGGKSPCIVDETAHITVAAKRIAWGKFWNAGQTCIAPDYLLVHEAVKDQLVAALQQAIHQFFGQDAAQSPDYPRIINTKRFDTLTAYLNTGHIITGGNHHREQLYIAPTLIDGVSPDDPIMQEEIFGPILPIITYTTPHEAEQLIQRNPYPLSLYIFTKNEKTAQHFTEQVAFGGGCINNTLIHFTNMNMPFGGVGYSGMGRYHGQYGFDTFSHRKSIMKTATWLDVAVKYAPFGNKLKLAKWLMK